MRLLFAAVLLTLHPGFALAQSGVARDTQLQRQHSQDEVVQKIRQSQELHRPVLSPEQRKELERAQGEEQVRQREAQDDQVRRAQQLEQEVRPLPEPQQAEQRALQDQGFERERIQRPVPAPAGAPGAAPGPLTAP
jgi:cytoskeletal protein RodZ